MRIVLAAVTAQKGDPDGNLARHRAALEQARVQGCHLAVFPEFSLTGSVDPRTHPERALPVDAGPVLALLEATRRSGVAAVFGIAERDGDGFHITQVYGHDGRLGGTYRKRHLGEGEEGYRAGDGTGVFRLGRPGSASPSAPRAGSTRARTTWPPSAASCARSWPAMTSRSAPGSAGAATPSGWLGRWMTQRERWVLCRAEPFEVDPAHVRTLAAEAIAELRWWSADELRSRAPVVTPRDLPGLLDRIARGDLPDPDHDLGV